LPVCFRPPERSGFGGRFFPTFLLPPGFSVFPVTFLDILRACAFLFTTEHGYRTIRSRT
jgi:hypothetical protein